MRQDVFDVILAKIRSGALPSARSYISYGGRGTNQTCDGCCERIPAEDVEYEVDLTEGRTLRFHQECFAAWQKARG